MRSPDTHNTDKATQAKLASKRREKGSLAGMSVGNEDSMRNVKRSAAILAMLAVSVGVLTGCGTNDKRDLEGVKSMDPDYAEVYNNTDGRPNVGLICVRGVAFATTTRDFTSIVHIKEWDTFCSQFKQHAIVPKQERKNG